MKLLTVFTPTYNRKHTIIRTYESLLRQTNKDFCWLIIDDGSTDNTKDWVLSLGNGSWIKGNEFDFMGRVIGDNGQHYVVDIPTDDGNDLNIRYVSKPNGGLYTGYNVAYATIQTELCVCIDSDDFMPDDAVEKISKKWRECYPQGSLTSNRSPITSKEYCGIVGLDYNVVDKKPIGGELKEYSDSLFYYEMQHSGDSKEVMRTDLMKTVSPMIGFEGEKDFNPFYMLAQIVDKYQILIDNSNYCWVEYQIGADSMSQSIYKQFVRSPRSYAKYRINQMLLIHNNSIKNKFKLCIHYISACIFIRDINWLKNSPEKALTILAIPFGILLNIFIRYKAR